MKNKIAIGLFGIHYLKNFNHWCDWSLLIDYKKTIQNNIDFFKYYQNTYENELTFFSSTYFSEKLTELIDDFNFKSLQLNIIDNRKIYGNNYIQKNRRLKETIKLILDNNFEYDLIILTRFDILLEKKIYDFKLNLDKINILYEGEWEGIHEIDDNFYVLSYNKLKYFYEQLEKIDEKIKSHHFHHYTQSSKAIIANFVLIY